MGKYTNNVQWRSGYSYIHHLGVAQQDISSVDIYIFNQTGLAGATYLEIGVLSGSFNPGGAPTVTCRGYTDVTSAFSTSGLKTVTVSVSGISAGDDVWVGYSASSSSAGAFYGVDDGSYIKPGTFAYKSSTRFSTMGSDVLFTSSVPTHYMFLYAARVTGSGRKELIRQTGTGSDYRLSVKDIACDPYLDVQFYQTYMDAWGYDETNSNYTRIQYLGVAEAAYTEFTVVFGTCGYTGTIYSADIGITTAEPSFGATTYHTLRGITDISTQIASSGTQTATITTSGITPGSHIWLAYNIDGSIASSALWGAYCGDQMYTYYTRTWWTLRDMDPDTSFSRGTAYNRPLFFVHPTKVASPTALQISDGKLVVESGLLPRCYATSPLVARSCSSIVAQRIYFMYLGPAEGDLSSVEVSYICWGAPDTITYAEIGICTSPSFTYGSAATMTRRGYTDISSGLIAYEPYAAEISVSGVEAGQHLWLAFNVDFTGTCTMVYNGSAAATAFGLCQARNTTRLSTMSDSSVAYTGTGTLSIEFVAYPTYL